ncbi:unnamed protein product [Penicillium roqueforti FM164]|uniref:Genomic scaffold, ProqFM164S04 n=1 Tax=Penicillium roqueforti (strain FM164) TaxID=1365484 RepID=W6QG17_PENRF|nr:unnamed protein product [Penicillium roqueforti FM164]
MLRDKPRAILHGQCCNAPGVSPYNLESARTKRADVISLATFILALVIASSTGYCLAPARRYQ